MQKILNKKFLLLVCFFLYFSNIGNALPADSIYNLNSIMFDKNGKKVNIRDFSGKIRILSMIYTNCKTICPIIVSNMKSIEKKLESNILDNIKFTLITLDSDKDTYENLNKFFKEKKLNENHWDIFKTSKRETLEIALSLGIKYKKLDNDEYVHSNLIIILDDNGVIKLHHQGLDKNYNKFIMLLQNIIKT